MSTAYRRAISDTRDKLKRVALATVSAANRTSIGSSGPLSRDARRVALGPALARTCARGRETAAPDTIFKDIARTSGSEGGRDAGRCLGLEPA